MTNKEQLEMQGLREQCEALVKQNTRMLSAYAKMLTAAKAALPLLELWVRERPHVNQHDNCAVDLAKAVTEAEGRV